jgi:HlyD family secretion protein
MFDKYVFPMAMKELETKLADAEREVATARKRGESTLGQKNVAVQQVEKRLKVQTEQLKQRQEDLENMALKAPCPGIVVYGNPHEPWYRDQVKVGGTVYGGFTVLTIPDLRVMQVKLQIHEADISKLKVGLPAIVTTDSYPGLQLEGEVSKIAAVAGSNNEWGGSSEVKKFDVEVTLKAGGEQMRPGISAKVEIHVETRTKTLFVPLQTVFAEEGVHYCHLQTPGKPAAKHKVQIGTSNDTYVEILDGLAEGDTVLLYNPMLPESGEASETPPKPDAPPPPAPNAPAVPTAAPVGRAGV